MLILGVPVGRDENKMRQLVTAIVDESAEFFERLLHHRLGVQEAMLLLRLSGNARLGYAQRTTSPNIHGPAAKAFADTIRGTLALPAPRDDGDRRGFRGGGRSG